MPRLFLLGKNIKECREAKGWSQQVLADHLTLSREYISRVEKGKKYLSLKKLFELTDLLDVKFKDLANFD